MCFDNKVNYLLYTIRNIGRLPRIGELKFADGIDQRTFYDNILKKIDKKVSDDSLINGYKLINETLYEFYISEEESDKRVAEFIKKVEDLRKKEEEIKETSEYVEFRLKNDEVIKRAEEIKMEQEKKKLKEHMILEAKREECMKEFKRGLRDNEKCALELVKLYINNGYQSDVDQLITEVCKIIFPNTNALENGNQKVIKK